MVLSESLKFGGIHGRFSDKMRRLLMSNAENILKRKYKLLHTLQILVCNKSIYLRTVIQSFTLNQAIYKSA